MNLRPADTQIFDHLPAGGKRGYKGKLRALILPAFVALGAVIVFLELGRLFLDRQAPGPVEAIAAISFLAVSTIFFSQRIPKYLNSRHDKISRHNRQLATLYKTGMAINSALGLEQTIRLILDEARMQTGASAGKLILTEPVLDLDGGSHAVYYSGFDAASCEVRSKSQLMGLNSVALKTGKPLRVDARGKHPDSVHLPQGHIPFDALLSVPLTNASGDCIGAIVVVKKPGAKPFTADDEALLVNFASQAAIAVVKAGLYEQVRDLSLLEERQRISREMHDGLGQIFAYLSIELKIIDDLLASGDVEKAKKMLEPLRLTAEETSADVRETIINLRTPLAPEADFHKTLEDYLRDFGERHEVKAVVAPGNGATPQFNRPVQIQLMCIIQEALANVRKHAQAQNVEVRMFVNNGTREVWIVDDGCGFAAADVPDHGRHLGLKVMGERAREAGGNLKIEAEPGKGTKVGIIFSASDQA